MGLVAALRVGEGRQDLPLLALPPGGELAVHPRLGPLVHEVALPATSFAGVGATGTLTEGLRAGFRGTLPR
nr:hypothetical protein GCM10025699_27860 [Microbacterium flavescens]